MCSRPALLGEGGRAPPSRLAHLSPAAVAAASGGRMHQPGCRPEISQPELRRTGPARAQAWRRLTCAGAAALRRSTRPTGRRGGTKLATLACGGRENRDSTRVSACRLAVSPPASAPGARARGADRGESRRATRAAARGAALCRWCSGRDRPSAAASQRGAQAAHRRRLAIHRRRLAIGRCRSARVG